MGRRRRNRRRQRFVTLDALQEDNKNIKSLVKEARGRGPGKNNKTHRSVQAQAVTERALADADAVTELFLVGVPRTFTAPELVKAVLINLYIWRLVPLHDINLHHNTFGNSSNSAVLRCEIRENKRGSNSNAFVTMRTSELAQTLLDSSPLKVQNCNIKVLRSKRLCVPGMGAAWRTSRDPGSMRWKIGTVQVGERVSDDLFCAFWASSPFFDLAQNSHVELNPVASVLAITIGRQQRVLKAIHPKGSKECLLPRSSVITQPDFAETYSMLRIEFPFRSICGSPRVEKNRRSTEGYAVYFPISKAPFLFRSERGPNRNNDLRTWDCLGGTGEETRWVRTVDPTVNAAFCRARAARIMLDSQEMYAFFKQLHHLCLADIPRPIPVSARCQGEKVTSDRTAMFQKAAKQYGLSFEIRYMVDCVLSLGTLRISDIDSEFWSTLAFQLTEEQALSALDWMLFCLSENDSFAKINHPIAMLRQCIDGLNIKPKQLTDVGAAESKAVEEEDTESDSENSIRTEDTEDFMMENYVRELRLEELNINDDENDSPTSFESETIVRPSRARLPSRQHAYIRRLIYTPTKTIAMKAESDLLNRVLREFSVHKDRFLRISFADEDGGSIGHAGSEDLYARVREALRNGVYTADASSIPPTADEIRKWMGDFSKIRVPGKFAARQGQTFSSTVGTVLLNDVQVAEIEDVYDRKREYMFSDGVGVISSELAYEVAKRLRLKRIPSAVQVRFGGAKGMLTVWDAVLHPGVEVALRPSMRKFESTHRALEIVGFSKRLPLFLNRQIIMLLSGMGVPDKPFEEMQGKLLKQLDRAMQSDGAADALDLLFTSGCCDSDVKLRAGAPMMNAGSFFRAGLSCASCEHLFNMMYAFRKRTIRDLMQRARIPIDSDKGVCALGVMDERGVLEADQVFCQYTEPASGKTVVVEGKVTVGRSPCLHPGDIQPLRAVDRPSLRHLVDLIVFPKQGWRPIPSMLSGGDLDGDIYFCIFDPDIAYPSSRPFPPMNYVAPKPRKLDHEITAPDVADFFVEYIRNDKLGQIANAHVVHADKERGGIHSEKCLELARLHSIAVDFAKTGVPADYPRNLQPKNEPEQYPDFMGKHPKVSYKSKKILGKLYRACNASRTSKDRDFEFFPNPMSAKVDSIIDSFPDDEDLSAEAEAMCEAYNIEVIRMMDQYGVRSEGEVMSGQVMSFTARHAQIRGRREHFALVMRLNRQANELRSHFRDEFFKGLGQRSGGEYSADTIIKACAWYKACRKHADIDRRLDYPVLVSFPWVVSDVLLQVIGNELN